MVCKDIKMPPQRLFGTLIIILLAHNNLEGLQHSFTCKNRPTGYYADIQMGCKVYHMCDTYGRRFSYTCPNTTLFQQRMLICDHWYMVNCSKSVHAYNANLLIGKSEAFIDESTAQRTPRPDLLVQQSELEFGLVYDAKQRNLSAQYFKGNLVGLETIDDKPYIPPGHWSYNYTHHLPMINSSQRSGSGDMITLSSQLTKEKTSTSIPNKYSQNMFGSSKYNFPAATLNTTRLTQTKQLLNHSQITSSKLGDNFIIPKLSQKPGAQQSNIFNHFKSKSNGASLTVTKTLITPFSASQYRDESRLNSPIATLRPFGASGTLFPSKYQATTPVYPLFVAATSKHPPILPPSPVNHSSALNFFPLTFATERPQFLSNFTSAPANLQTYNMTSNSKNQNKHSLHADRNKLQSMSLSTTNSEYNSYVRPDTHHINISKSTNIYTLFTPKRPNKFLESPEHNSKSNIQHARHELPINFAQLRSKFLIPNITFLLNDDLRPQYLNVSHNKLIERVS